MSSKLPPLDLTEEIAKYDAKAYVKNVELIKCCHKQVVYDKEKGELKCPCGVAFAGPRLGELEKLLKTT